MAARARRVRDRRRRARAQPSTAILPAADGLVEEPETPLPSMIIHRAPDGTIRTQLDADALAAVLRDGAGALWADVDTRDPAQVVLLEQVFQFHPLSVEDTLNPNSRVKLEEYPEYLFAIIRGVRFDERTADPYDLETFNLCFFLGPNLLVTARRASNTACDVWRSRVRVNPDVLDRGTARLMHAIMDQAVDDYFPLLDRLDDFVEALDERVFAGSDEAVLRDIFAAKRLVLTLRRHLLPQREVMNALTNRPGAFLPADAQVYFRDIHDHVLRMTDALDTYRELLSATLDGSLTQTSNRLATATKTLSVLAVLSIPFVIVSGMWGMNFSRVPLEDAPYGFWGMLLIQLALGAAMIGLLRWRRLL